MNMRPLPIYDDRPIFEKLRELEKRVHELEVCVAQMENETLPDDTITELEKKVQVLESYLQADPAFLPYGQLEKRIDDLERDRNTLSTAVAELQRVISEFIRMQAQKVPELEGKVESLTRTLDMLQEVIGIEVVITAQAHEGQCEKCDRVGQLNDGNICEGCFYEEIGV